MPADTCQPYEPYQPYPLGQLTSSSPFSPPPPASPPVLVDAASVPDPRLSRWLWLVKGVLVIPHWVVLVFLWLAFVVLTVVAFFAILFTGRYPRSVFDFNVGVLRWTWRVHYYLFWGFGTAFYHHFTRGEFP